MSNKNKNRSLEVEIGSVIDNLLDDFPDARTFIFKPGTYHMTKSLKVNREQITFIGKGEPHQVHIVQTNPNTPGLDVEANHFTMKNISLHVEHDNQVAITFAGTNNCTVFNCNIFGNESNFTVYFAGKDPVHPTIPTHQLTAEQISQIVLDDYENGNMDSNNVFKKNVVLCKWRGDAVSVSLQKNFDFSNNVIRGGKVALYLCKELACRNNIIYDSIDAGIHVSLPSYDLTITNNCIYEANSAGIIVERNKEHPGFLNGDNKIIIHKNTIYDVASHGIILNGSHNVKVEQNSIVGTNNDGDNRGDVPIYVQDCENIKFNNNEVSYFKYGIQTKSVLNLSAKQNIYYSVYPFEAQHVLVSSKSCNNIVFTENTIKGRIKSRLYWIDLTPDETVSGTTQRVNIENNTHEEYFDLQENRKIFKIK